MAYSGAVEPLELIHHPIMSASVYAVIVHAQPGKQANEVAPRLAPLLNLREETVRDMCARGFVTVESSLSEEEGMFVLARLQAEGLPAELVDEAKLLSTSALSSVPSSPDVKSVALFAEEDWNDMMGSLDFLDDEPAQHLPALEEVVIHPPPRAADSSAATAGWGALFPDIETARATPAAPPGHPPIPPSSALPSSPPIPMSFGAEPVASPQPTRGFGAEPEALLPDDRPTAPAPQQSSSDPRQPGAFQGGQLLQALGMDREEQPPYMPQGYDPRPPHSPVIARWLSILAPGAGQVYNGEDRLSFDYGLRFFLILPWIRGVQQAERRAQKIATYWAPRPAMDHMVRTLKYMGTWYLSVAGVISVCVIAGLLVHDQLTHTHVEPVALATVDQAVKDARLEVQQARIAGLDSMNDMVEEIQTSRSQMSKEERINRLFIRGFEDCQRGHFPSCEETMRRVSDLADGKHRDAFRLQAWAAMRRQGGQATPMPVVDTVVRSLAEYEMLQHESANEDAALDTPPLDAPVPDPPVDSAEP